MFTQQCVDTLSVQCKYSVFITQSHTHIHTVFDDGDERTLKRSSLCLKGGRHFHESESLDHLPLTDPENFGTPVVHASKRKRRRVSRSPSQDREEAKKRFSYPPDFPVGKVCVCV